MAADDKTMFEIYRESDYNRAFHYIFYTELEEHGRDAEIARAASGQTVFTGYLADARKEQARAVVEAIVDELNDMDDDADAPPAEAIAERLAPYLAPNPG
jgi:dihydropteroate synthase